MDDEEFDIFRRSVVAPMIQRHKEMFPRMHGGLSLGRSESGPSPPAHPAKAGRGERYPGTPPHAPCPCNSGEKYKFCCRAKGA
jgi:hypothetical protein